MFLLFNLWGKNVFSLYCQKLSHLLSSFLLSALSIKVTLQSSIPLCSGSLKCWWKCSWLTFGGLTDLDIFRCGEFWLNPYTYLIEQKIIHIELQHPVRLWWRYGFANGSLVNIISRILIRRSIAYDLIQCIITDLWMLRFFASSSLSLE